MVLQTMEATFLNMEILDQVMEIQCLIMGIQCLSIAQQAQQTTMYQIMLPFNTTVPKITTTSQILRITITHQIMHIPNNKAQS